MKNIEFQLKDRNDPFVQGFCSFFLQNFIHGLPDKRNLVQDKKVIIGDRQGSENRCDIGLMNVDTDWIRPNAKIVFSNAQTNYLKDEYYFPYLFNVTNSHLEMDEFEEIEYEKKYHCIAIFNAYTNQLRIDTVKFLEDVCDIVIIDCKNVKTDGREIDISEHFPSWNFLRDSKFCICPPGHVSETYRFYEALRCNCIPLEFDNSNRRLENFSDKYILNINSVTDAGNFDKIKSLEYSKEELKRVQNNLDRKFLIRYLADKMQEYDI